MENKETKQFFSRISVVILDPIFHTSKICNLAVYEFPAFPVSLILAFFANNNNNPRSYLFVYIYNFIFLPNHFQQKMNFVFVIEFIFDTIFLKTGEKRERKKR